VRPRPHLHDEPVRRLPREVPRQRRAHQPLERALQRRQRWHGAQVRPLAAQQLRERGARAGPAPQPGWRVVPVRKHGQAWQQVHQHAGGVLC
jgi:hypothetical protein